MVFAKIVFLGLLAFVAKSSGQALGQVTIGNATVMCNCAAPNGANYKKFNHAADKCSGYPQGSAGFGSCVTNSLGFLSVDGRSVDVEGLLGMFGDAAVNCDAPSISSKSFKASTWVWQGQFDFNSLDSSLTSFYTCANSAALSICENQLRESLGKCNA